jgi:cyclophilin family peptidyl-prolyl cis-trans isomerase
MTEKYYLTTIRLLLLLAVLAIPRNFAVAQQTNRHEVLLETTEGNIRLALYNETPRHRDNFLKLVKEHFYDSLLFHRVIPNFMIQAGDPDSRKAEEGAELGDGDLGYTLEPEFRVPEITHRRGSLAAAREGDEVNPDKRSSACQFYIVTRKWGAKHLDGSYTVFGEVVQGMEVADRISKHIRDDYDRPVGDVRIIKATVVR